MLNDEELASLVRRTNNILPPLSPRKEGQAFRVILKTLIGYAETEKVRADDTIFTK
jgi:hypothetical protein